jgi:hypothetical protein
MQTGFQTGNADQLPLILVAKAYDEFVEKMDQDPEIVFKVIDGKGAVTTSSPIFAAFVNDKIANSQAA